MKCQDCQMIELYLFYKYLALRQFREAGPKYPISCAGKVIQSLQLQILHQMRPYSNVKAIRGSSSYTCLRVFGSLGQFWQTGPKYPKIISRDTQGSSYTCLMIFGHQGNLRNWRNTRSNPKSSAPHSKSNEALFQCQGSSEGPLLPALQVFEHYGNLGKLVTNTPHRHTKSNSGSSAPHFTSNQPLLKVARPSDG